MEYREGQLKLSIIRVVVWKPNIVEPSKNMHIYKMIQRKMAKKTGETNENVDIRNELYLTDLLTKASQWKPPNNLGCCSGYWVFFKTDSRLYC